MRILATLRGFWNRHSFLANVAGSLVATGLLALLALIPAVRDQALHLVRDVSAILSAPVAGQFWHLLAIASAIPVSLGLYRLVAQHFRVLTDPSDIRTAITGWLRSSDPRRWETLRYADVDRWLRLTPGSAKALLIEVAQQNHLVVRESGPTTVLLSHASIHVPRPRQYTF